MTCLVICVSLLLPPVMGTQPAGTSDGKTSRSRNDSSRGTLAVLMFRTGAPLDSVFANHATAKWRKGRLRGSPSMALPGTSQSYSGEVKAVKGKSEKDS